MANLIVLYINGWRYGVRVDAKPDIWPLDGNNEYILLVISVAGLPKIQSPSSLQGAIAAFYENKRRRSLLGFLAVQAKTFVGITIFSTVPTFYKIPITSDLLRSIMTGQSPPSATRCYKLVASFPNTYQYGKRPLENGRVALQCFEALKLFV
ncbi:hypothetical protein E1B28_003324 [Marasmius oreades]|uniref:Uncharacterized protein n=1 Tax=Marasmius oreades TaxID=181124 RepID=A0A9P7RMU4_9AGAR|nr:uncharacterized protein E1B28_003324 [Marasmius oreades]KAG7085783.1 hypothetical protein E1B28_003324 [Marasmius oreades]